MANQLINIKADRLHTYKGILQVESGINTYQFKFIQEMNVDFNDDDLDRARIDDGSPAFTRIGDVLGAFGFRLGGTVDLGEAVDPPVNEWLPAFWIDKLTTSNPAEISFIQTFNAPDSAGNKFLRLRFQGRIMKIEPVREEEVGLNDFNIEGEIIGFTSLLRELS